MLIMNNISPAVLTIAGSDSGGGAGIQADLRTFSAFKVYGTSVITAVTAQNPNEVRRVDIMPTESVKSQLETILDAFPICYAKTGMLGNAEIVECTAELAQKYNLKLIVDPVMVSTSRAKLLEDSAIEIMKNKLFPIAEWITPNIPEAELICDREITTLDELADSALQLYNQYKCNCFLKGGHAIDNNKATDIICYQGELFTLSSPIIKFSGNTTHGTGCTLSSALTANFATGKSWQESCLTAKNFVYGSLVENVNLNTNLQQMYPPEKEYFEEIIFEKY